MFQTDYQEPPRAARWIKNHFAWLGVENLHDHLYDVPGREKLPLTPAQRRTDEHLESFSHCVPISFDYAVVLKLPNDVGYALRIECDRILNGEHIRVFGSDMFIEQLDYPFLHFPG